MEMPWGKGSVRILSPTWSWLPGKSTFQGWTASNTLLRTKAHRLGTHGSGYLENCFSRTIILPFYVCPISEGLLALPGHDSCPGGRFT